ncbi:vacuolar protein sorting-associated protein 33B-like [Argiope bruennichi]|uniref:Vacuolar protein sorting-associated protein like n=1 Tax=Argiope bruennichi TaxID=94029 RepID=A0A8T0FG60_ARGBR|nr:vacuolar protein sorting-associated protein 33B-like [Argiope bruennichi]KAF8789208.1 Vacuolar protein sorting-associated protein like [Argiope bruennichi]
MTSKLNLLSTIIKQASADKLFNLLNSIDGNKDLVLDKELICSLDYIASFSQLKTCKVEKVFKLEPGAAPGRTEKCVYLIKPTIQNTKIIADHISASRSIDSNKRFWIINVPRKLFACETVLEREGVYGHVKQMELPLGFLCLDRDLFSLELPDFFNSFYIKGDLTYVHTAAMALVQLCKICGPLPKIFGQGKCAKMVIDLMNLIMKETTFDSSGSDKLSHLVILDRDIDYVSVLLSQLTYEGMLDEFFGINSGRIIFPKEVTAKEESIKVVLNSSDVVFSEIRNNYFASVFSLLRDKAKELQAKSETSSMSLGDIKKFVTQEMKNIRQQHTSLSLHIGACEVILNTKSEENFQERLRIERDILEGQNLRECLTYTEDVINRQDSYSSALRLMCLLSISQDGLLSADYESLAIQFRQSYGCKYVSTLYKLKKLGLLLDQAPLLPPSSVRSSKITEVATNKATKIAEKVATAVAFPKYSSFRAISKKFNLIPSEEQSIDLKNPTDMSYVFGGTYVPLVGKITEQIVVHGTLKNLEENMKLLPGSTLINYKADKDTGYVIPTKDIASKTVFVYVLGGITFAEVAALRLLGQLHGCKILIGTTSFISGNSLLKSLSPVDES